MWIRKRVLVVSVFIFIITLCGSWTNFSAQSTKEVYEVNTCKDLESIGKGINYSGATHTDAWTKYDDYILGQDIDCLSTNPENVNHDLNAANMYGDDGFDEIESISGTVDGNGNQIIGLYSETGFVNSLINGTITNLTIVDSIIDSTSDYTGGIVGDNNSGTIENSSFDGSVSGGLKFTGGLVGFNDGVIQNSFTNGTVSGDTTTGGISGRNEGNIENTYFIGNINANATIGGLSGANGGVIKNSYSVLNVPITGEEYVGGLVGMNKSGNIINSFVVGDVKAPHFATSVGYMGTIENSYPYAGSTVNDKYNIQEENTLLATRNNLYDASWYTDTLKWDSVWDLTSLEIGSFPQLSGLSNQVTTPLPLGNSKPKISGNLNKTVENNFTDLMDLEYLGLEITDEEDGKILVTENNLTVISDDGFNATQPGTYNVIYQAKDSDGNLSDEYTFKVQVGYLLINTCEDLESIGKGTSYPGATHNEAWEFSGGYRLTKNIDCSNVPNFNSVGSNVESEHFTGELDGDGYYIDNLNSTGGGIVEINDGEIYDLGFINTNIDSNIVYGGTIARKNYGLFQNIYTKGEISGVQAIGGLVGENYGKISNSYSNSNVSGRDNIGGLVGQNEGEIFNTYSTGVVNGSTGFVGGLVGENYGGIKDSYSVSLVKCPNGNDIGGLVGYNAGSIQNTYATGDVQAKINGGGLVGFDNGNVTNSFRYEYASVENPNEVGIEIGLEQFTSINWYTNVLGFDNNWKIDELVTNGFYPHLLNSDKIEKIPNQNEVNLPDGIPQHVIPPEIKGERTKTISYIDLLDIEDYNSLGITASDAEGNDITNKIKLKNNENNFISNQQNSVGTYNLVYTVIDIYGNESKDYNYTIYVINYPPEIIIDGPQDFEHISGEVMDYSPDAINMTAVDYEDGDLTSQIKITNNRYDGIETGIFLIKYTVADSLDSQVEELISITVT